MAEMPLPILIVDDNPAGLYAKTRLLTRHGYRVLTALTGLEALAVAVAEQPDLALIDVNLPDIDGFEICQRLKRDHATQFIRVLQTSAARTQALDRVKGLEAGADAYLIEPMEDEELIGTVRALIALAAKDRENRRLIEQLSRTERQLREATDAADCGLWDWDIPTGALQWFGAHERLAGVRPGSFSGKVEAFTESLHPDDRARVWQRLQATMASREEDYADEYRFIRSDGSVRWMGAIGRFFYNGAGDAVRMTGIVRDVTEQKQAERQLLLRNARLALVARISQDLLFQEGTEPHSLQPILNDLATSLGYEMFFHFQAAGPGTLRLEAAGGVTDEQRARYATIRVGQYLCGLVAEGRERLIAEDLPHAGYAESAELCAAGVRCYAGFPLLVRGRLLGTLAVATRSSDRVPPEDVEFLQTACDQLSNHLARTQVEAERERAQQALLRQKRQTERLYELAGAVNRAVDLAELYEIALDALATELQAERAGVLLFDGYGVMRFQAWRGLSDTYRRAAEGHSPWQPGQTQAAPIMIEDVSVAELDPDLKIVILEEGIRALAFIPLTYSGGVIGKFMVYFGHPHRMNEDDIDLALSMANTLATGIERKCAEEALRGRNRRLDYLSRTAHRLLLGSQSERDLLCEIFSDIAQLLDMEMFYHYRLGDEPYLLELQVHGGITEEERSFFASMRFGELLCGRVAERKERLIVEDLQHSSHPGSDVLRAAGATSYAGFPLLANGELVGTIAFVSRRRIRLQDGDVELIETVCHQLAATLERTRLERELRRSEERLRLASEAAGFGAYDFDPVRRESNWSANLRAMFNLPAEKPVSFDQVLATIHPEDRARAASEFRAAIEGRYPDGWEFEFRVVRADGQVRWFVDSGKPIYEEEGGGSRRVVRVLGLVQDATVRKQAEEQLRASERRFRSIFDHQFQFSALLSPDGRVVEVSESPLRRSGFSREQILGRHFLDTPWWDRLPEARAQWQRQITEAQARPGPSRGEAAFETADGAIRYALNTTTAIRNERGELEYLLVEGIDITDRKQAEGRRTLLMEVSRLALESPEAGASLTQTVFDKIQRPLGLDVCFNYRLSADAKSLELVAGIGIPAAMWSEAQRLDVGQAFCGVVAATCAPLMADAARIAGDAQGAFIRGMGVRAYACHPLFTHDGRVMGTLSFASGKRDAFSPDDFEFLQIICHFVAIAWERDAVSAALRESHARLEATQTYAPIGIVETSIDGEYLSVNEEFCRMTGYSSDELLQTNLRDITHADDWPRDHELLEGLVQNESSTFHMEKRYVRKDGGVVWAEIKRTVVKDGQGKPLYVIGAVLDITTRKAAENSLRESEKRLHAILERAPGAVFIKDREGRYEFMNPECARVLNLLPEEGIGKTDHEMLPALVADQLRRNDVEVWRSGRIYVLEETAPLPDGLHTFYSQKFLLRDAEGIPYGLCGIATDITELKRQQSHLRDRERLLSAVTGAARVGLVIIEPDYVYRYANEAYTELLGLPPHPSLVGRHVYEILPEVWAQIQPRLDRAFAGERISYELSLPPRNQRQAASFFAVSYEPHRNEENVQVVVVVVVDITERKRTEQSLRDAQERLRQWNLELEQTVNEKTADLLQSQDRLRMLATELNLAEQRERKRLAAELHDHLQQMLVLGRMKLGTYKRFADAAPAAGKVMTEIDAVLAESLQYTRTLVAELSPPGLLERGLAPGLVWLAEYMKRYGLTVTVTVPEADHGAISQDQAVLLYQSVRELLINSSKHAGTDRAWVLMEQDVNLVRIEVRDEGAGFDLAAAAAAAQPSGGLSSKFGLFSIRERMKALGGSFEVESASPKGTTATLVLPLSSYSQPGSSLAVLGSKLFAHGSEAAASNLEGQTSNPERPQQRTNQIRVLLVDDHAMMRQGLRAILDGYDELEVVGEACDGLEAVAAAQQLRPHVVVMDINMPKKNGIDAVKDIKARWPEIDVIGLSVSVGAENQEAILKAGARLLLTKEAAVERLYDAIQETVKKHTERA